MDQIEGGPVEIPFAQLDLELLRRIAEEFVLREGTDYGLVEVSLETKINQVLAQIKRGDASVMFDPSTESVTLNPRAGR